ncbi:hypothetical protein BsWGS_24854 [Bradybaena similaris]
MLKMNPAYVIMFISVSLVNSVLPADLICGDDCTFGGSRYLFIKDAVTWHEAESLCKSSGGYLVEVNSKEENDWLVGQLKARKSLSVWMGGNDIRNEGVWEWRSSKIGPFTAWGRGEPNDYLKIVDSPVTSRPPGKWQIIIQQ